MHLVVVRRHIFIFLGALFFLSASQLSWGQCVVTGSFPIPEVGQNIVNINVNGLVNGSLDSPGQGLCGVRIKFNHSHIGDVLLQLRSPSGQIIELTGPETSTSPTSLASWDVTFIPCGDVAAPDPGFSDQWNNDQAWALIGSYSGSYYPYTGCLESLTGSANGLWTLIATDNQQFDDGLIEEIELIFCDNNGQNCSECLADGGVLPTDTVEQCANETPVDFNLDPVFPDGPLDPAYAYFYVVNIDGIVSVVTSQFNNSGLSPGIFTVCGVSVTHGDTNRIKSFPANIDMAGYETFLLSENICFEFSSTCAVLRVKPELPAEHRDRTICQGESFLFGNLNLTESGFYSIRGTGANGCLKNITLNLTVLDLAPQINVVEDFGCGVDVATLFGRDSIFNNDVIFQWYSPDGTILTDASQNQIEVEGSGSYFLITRRNFGAVSFCSDTTSVTLVDNFEEPQISYIGTLMSCAVDSSQVRSISTLPSATLIWRNNQTGSEDTVRNHLIYFEEDYTLVAVSPQGCRDSVDVILPYDTIHPSIILNDINKVCLNDSVLLSPGVINPDWSYFWILPNGDSVQMNEFRTDEIGSFRLSATSQNGCTTIEELNVNHMGIRPEFQILSDTFYCYTDSISISVSSNLSEISYQITGPRMFTSNDHDVVLQRPGWYTITVETSNGCTYDTLWYPPTLRMTTEVDILGDTLDCDNDSIQLAIDTFMNELRYLWQGPGDFSSDQAMPFVKEDGLYSLELRTKTGCIILGDYEVLLDTLKPDLTISAGVLDCNTDSVLFRVTARDDGYLYDWEGPNNWTSTRKKPWAPFVGWYFTTVTNVNGCQSFFSNQVLPDYDVPTIQIDATNITCEDLVSDVTVTTDAVFVEWNGPGLQTNATALVLPALDTFNLYLLGANACDTSITYIPPVDTTHPQLELFTDILGCNRDTVPLLFSSDLEIRSQEWSGPWIHDASSDSTFTTESGMYNVLVTSINGCQTLGSINVIENYSLPIVDIEGTDSLSCLIDSAFLYASTSMTDLDFYWTLPNGLEYEDSAILSLVSGEHRLIAEAPNSCRDTTYFIVVADTLLPELNLTADTINCVQSDAIVDANLDQDEMVEWTWPNNTMSNLPSFLTTIIGEYKAVVTNSRSGCIDSATVTVLVDTTKISNSIIGDDTISCNSLNALLISNLSETQAQLSWSGPLFSANQIDSIFVDRPGQYILQSSLPSQCFDLDTFEVLIDTMSPSIILIGDTLKCDQPKVELSFISDATEGTFEWSGPGGYSSPDSTPFVQTGGYYTLTIINPNGCVSRDSVLIVGDTLSPEVSVVTDLFSCDDTTAAVSAISSSIIEEYIWFGPDGFSEMGENVQLDRIGEFVVFALAQNGCIAQDTFILDEFDLIDSVQLVVDSINCSNLIASHSVSTTELNVTYEWFEDLLSVSNTNNLISGFGGDIRVNISNVRGCEWDSIFSVYIDTIAPDPIIQQIGEIKCESQQIELLATNIDPLDLLNYMWLTTNGDIIGDISTPQISIGSAGTYLLQIENSRNGCEGEDELIVLESVDSLLINEIIIQQPHCNNNYTGVIEIVNVSGAFGDLTYFIDEEGPILNPIFDFLDSGDHLITVVDELGCRDTILAEIENVVIRFVDIERDTILRLGDNMFIDDVNNFDENMIQSIFWTLNGETICSGCDSLNIQPTESGNYAVHIIDTNGCAVSDSIFVQVVSVPAMYIPNAFSPNGDGTNDEIGPYFGNNVSVVNEFSIFTRWGDRLHHRLEMDPANLDLFWNGRVEDKLMNPGLFIYTISIELIDGRVINRQGEFHLVR